MKKLVDQPLLVKAVQNICQRCEQQACLRECPAVLTLQTCGQHLSLHTGHQQVGRAIISFAVAEKREKRWVTETDQASGLALESLLKQRTRSGREAVRQWEKTDQ